LLFDFSRLTELFARELIPTQAALDSLNPTYFSPARVDVLGPVYTASIALTRRCSRPGPQRHRARRLLDGHGRAHTISRRLRLGAHQQAALLGAIPPFLLKIADNPEGVDRSVFDAIKAAVIADRPAYFKDFLDNVDSVDR
jgi:hypothetical protein